jgi:hypothetical protein
MHDRGTDDIVALLFNVQKKVDSCNAYAAILVSTVR